MNKIIRVFLTIMLGFTMSCNQNDHNSQNNELTDITWILFKYFDPRSGINTIIPEENESYSIIFRDSGIINAKDACNDCTASFEILNDSPIVINSMSCTEMACVGPQYFPSFDGDFSYQIDNDTLKLTKSNFMQVFYFVQ